MFKEKQQLSEICFCNSCGLNLPAALENESSKVDVLWCDKQYSREARKYCSQDMFQTEEQQNLKTKL